MEVAMKISDDLMRDAAVRQIVVLCLTARDMKTARILVPCDPGAVNQGKSC